MRPELCPPIAESVVKAYLKIRPCLVALCVLGVRLARAEPGATAAPVQFNRDIRPLLSDTCFPCHGPDTKKLKGGLRLDLRELALKPAKSKRVAIVPGQPDQSELIARILATNADDVMPPPESHKALTSAKKELLRRWIAEGAEYQGHWAYLAPVKTPVPGVGRAIDFLVQTRQEGLGLRTSPSADRRTLARRLHFDLAGLPPRPQELDAFQNDPSPDAYAKRVETLLASPRYGERMAIAWLDVVRFADTIGYHSDNPRAIWPYRDYVIRSFNENKPFDQFTREQIAGDLLPGSTQEQKVGSAFNRLLLSTEEGGAQPKDYEARMLTDRVRAVATIWLGQTIGCSQCHDHKFDPITMRDFYSLGAFFADIKEPIIGRREDGVVVPDSRQALELARLEAKVAHAQNDYETPRPDWQKNWEKSVQEILTHESHWIVLAPHRAVSAAGGKLTVDQDQIITSERDPRNGKDTYRISVKTHLKGITGFRLEALSGGPLPARGPGRGAEGNFVVTGFRVEDAQTNEIALAEATATFETEEFPARAVLHPGTDGKPGWSPRARTGVNQAIHFTTPKALEGEGQMMLTFVIRQDQGGNQVLGRFRLSATTLPGGRNADATAWPPPEIVQILQRPAEQRSAEQKALMAVYHRSSAPELAGLHRHLTEARQAQTNFEATLARCLISVALDKPRTVRILPRGNWMIETGDIVQPALPAYLTARSPAASDQRPLNRLDLANWLVARDNPLTARVIMNRLWKQFFGVGLSKVLDDFGAQGEPPLNPALLDWLASEFMESGWDVKHMVRLIVQSRTYQQVSTASTELQSRDPDNRELARQGRWRLEAELVRDNALAISGLLVGKIGGPSVKPYQPDSYWENLNFPVRTYEASQGGDQYRRGLYTWWQRSYVHPSMLAFDAPSREECAADRNRSNIPQQALVLLNDPSYVEAARALATRILQECHADPNARITWAWREALARAPQADELATVRALFDKHLSEYGRDPAAAGKLISVGTLPLPRGVTASELAAWTSVARVILNLHETITRS